MKTDSMQTRMKMDRKRKRAVGTVIKNVKWASVFWRERERERSLLVYTVSGLVSLVENTNTDLQKAIHTHIQFVLIY